MAERETTFTALRGGLDLISSAIETPPGKLIGGVNYEPHPKGYQRKDGVERFDGRPKPSEATYWILNFDAGTDAFVEGEVATGAGGATGECLINAVVTSGSWAGNDAAGYLVLVNGTGTYVDDEALTGSGSGAATVNGTSTNRGADNDTDDDTWLQDAIETTRADIQTVTGAGVMRGVWVYNGDTYAFRNNAGETAVVMFKATTAGWVAQALGFVLEFTSGGTTEIEIGDEIEGETGGATATVTGVQIDSGAWADGDAAGRFVFLTQTGTFQSETLKVGANLNLATIAGDSSANTLAAGGEYEFENHNFGGHSGTLKMWGVNGVGKAFSWDGTTYQPIHTGMTTDTPNHLMIHKQHLVLSFSGGSVQTSGTGAPYSWTVVTGASEMGMGDEVTAMQSQVSGVAVIFARSLISVLYGSDVNDWDLVPYADDAGAIEWTVQKIGVPLYADDQGIRKLTTTQQYGDFRLGTVTQAVEPLIQKKKADGVTMVASIRVRAKDQYRIYFSDNTGLVIYFGRKTPEITTFDLGMRVYCICSSEDSSGNEIIFMGSDDGYIYQLDAGTSDDGSAITAWIRLPFNHVGSPARNKRWHKADLEVDSPDGTTALSVAAEFNYADPDHPAGTSDTYTLGGGGGFWNEDNWDDFMWSAQVEGIAEAAIEGLGRNVSLAILSEATYEQPHILHGLTLHHSDRGLAR